MADFSEALLNDANKRRDNALELKMLSAQIEMQMMARERQVDYERFTPEASNQLSSAFGFGGMDYYRCILTHIVG